MLSADLKAELLRLFDEIVAMGLGVDQWAERESSDMFQSDHFSGGFDATEGEFLFSYLPESGGEFWFGVALEDVQRCAATREVPVPEMRLAE